MPGALAAPFADGAELKTAVDSCLHSTLGDPTGVACCSRPSVNCGPAGTTEMADWDVSMVTNMRELFYGKTQFNADISRWDTSRVTDMYRMFRDARAFNEEIGAWDTSSVTTMDAMFYHAYAFNQPLSRWDVSSVTNMRHMFDNARAFNKNILGWDTYNTNRQGSWHYYCIFCSADAWNARFEGGGSNTLPDRGWTRRDDACDASLPPFDGDVGTCTDTLASGTSCVPECNAGYVLKGVTSCTGRVLTEVASCVWLFADRSELKTTVDVCLDAVPSGERCCSSDRWCWHPDPAMRRCGAVGCVDMPDWETGKVTSMVDLFHDIHQFNQSISSWDVARVERFDRLFKCSGTCEFTGGDLSRWDTSSAKSMASMFEGRSRFNSDISRWDVRGVTDMSHMFENASVFTADITRWRTDSLVNSSNMFLGADTWRTLHAQCGKENDPYYDDDTCAHHPEKADEYIDHSSGPPGAWTRLVKRWRRDFFFGDDIEVDAANHEFGSRDGNVSVSYDGKRIAAAGTRWDVHGDVHVSVSYVRVFEWNEDEGWKRAGGDVEAGQDFAGELCLSGDGKRLALGDPNGRAVHVYRFNQSRDWDRLGDALNFTGFNNASLEQPSGSDFGRSVSLSRDGSVLAVGAPGGSGSVRAFRWDASRASWSQMGVDIVGPHGTDVPARLGAAVSLSLDGTRLAALAPGAGVARVFRWDRASSSWSKMGGDSTAGAFGAGRGPSSIALSGDGSHLALGAPDADDGVGVVAVYRWTRTRDSAGSTWEANGEWRMANGDRPGESPLAGGAAGDRFGSTVSLSRDGTRLAVGAERGVDGYVRVFDWIAEDSSWRMAPAVNLDGAPGERFGRDARLSGAGAILAVVGRGEPDGGSSGVWKVIAHALECDPEAAGPPPNGRTGECSAVARLLNVTGVGANATCAPECHDGFDLTEASACDPFTGGFRSGRCLCACDKGDKAWRAKGFYM